MAEDKQQELDQLRSEAIKQQRCFGVTRLRDQFKMKPKPGATPADWIKSPYNKRQLNPVYCLEDCVPLKTVTKKPATPKQILGRKISGLKAKLRSKANATSQDVRKFLAKHSPSEIVVLDSETTGLCISDQIIELAIIDFAGNILMNQRFRPTTEICPEAADIHSISMEELQDCPQFADHIEQIKKIINGKIIVIFNADFDIGMLRNSTNAFAHNSEWVSQIKCLCAMEAAANVYGSTNRYGSISLATAADIANVEWQGASHSAVADCFATRDVMLALADYSSPLEEEIKKLEKEKSRL